MEERDDVTIVNQNRFGGCNANYFCIRYSIQGI